MDKTAAAEAITRLCESYKEDFGQMQSKPAGLMQMDDCTCSREKDASTVHADHERIENTAEGRAERSGVSVSAKRTPPGHAAFELRR